VLDGDTRSSFANSALALPVAASFLLGIVVSVANVLWMLIVAKAKIAVAIAMVVSTKPVPAMVPAIPLGQIPLRPKDVEDMQRDASWNLGLRQI
jgi:hypothetical protein